eukprot:scaffold26102_cov75-Cyclotella_meneghiniana.AAC.4
MLPKLSDWRRRGSSHFFSIHPVHLRSSSHPPSMLPRIATNIFLIIYSASIGSLASAFISNHCKSRQRHIQMHRIQDTRVSNTNDEQFRIGYASDIEGHWDYFLDYVSRSNVIGWESIPNQCPCNNFNYNFYRLTLRPNTHFIYGGDSVDKGPGDIRFTRALVDLKKRYPRRVHLLVGNRDLNKLRFQTELGDYEMSLPLDEIQKPFWDKNALSYREYLEKQSGEKPVEKRNTKVNKLKWMLDHTLGCPTTFEFRRQEIRILKQIYGQYPINYESGIDLSATVIDNFEVDTSVIVTDEQVVESFEHEINCEMGSLWQYLKHANIAVTIGNTIFVHGAIDALTMKYVPLLDSKFELPTEVPKSISTMLSPSSNESTINNGTMIENVHEWVESLNNYLQRGLEDFRARPNWNPDRSSRGGEALLAIQNRPSMWGRSVVCNSYGDGGVIATVNSEVEQVNALKDSIEGSNPLSFEGTASNALDPEPAKWLLDHQIRRIVVGHKPTGDCPSVLSASYTGVEIVSADISYSRRKELDNTVCLYGECRGAAISLIEIVGSEHSNWLEMSGNLACGRPYSNRFPMLYPDSIKNEASDIGDTNLGKQLPDGWWVKAAISTEQYHLCRGSGRSVEYELRLSEDVRRQLNDIPCT